VLLTVRNVGRVLDLFSTEHPERGVTETACLLGISRSKAHALMASMTAIGLLRRVAGGRYRIGWRALSLGRIATSTTPYRAPALRNGARLVREWGEAVHLATLEEGRVVYVDRLLGPNSLRLAVAATGASLPAHCSGVGKVLLAGRPDAEIAEVVDRHGLARFTPSTITDPQALLEALRGARAFGFAADREEAVAGVSCFAAPIVDGDGRTVAAMSVSAPTERLRRREAELRRAILGVTRATSQALREAAHPG
jgi:DNA-binding IclR family transcriptional regulator